MDQLGLTDLKCRLLVPDRFHKLHHDIILLHRLGQTRQSCRQSISSKGVVERIDAPVGSRAPLP
jgi:hypothetical protein